MILVVTATATEMKAAFGVSGMEQGETREFEFNGHKLLLGVAGVGVINTALFAGRVLGMPGIKGVVNLGIGGAYELSDFPIGMTAYAWREIWPEYGVVDEDGVVDPTPIGFPQDTIQGNVIWDRIKLSPANDAETMGLSFSKDWGRGSFITVSSVTGSADRAGWLKGHYTADIENMEGFAIGYAAQQKGLPFFELRTVSNLAGSRYEEDWDLKGALKNLGASAQQLFAAS